MKNNKLTIKQWRELYQTIVNTNDSIDFETYGEDLDFIRSQNNNHVWTEVLCDDEETYIVPGYHLVNRLMYFVTKKPWSDENIEVNCNEMVDLEQAAQLCINFLRLIGYEIPILIIAKHFVKSEEEMLSVGKAKYMALNLYKEHFGKELTSEEEDELHDFYSQIL